MFSIPVGEVFEAFINWLKDSFSMVFNGISAVLNFAIEALENVLLLDHSQIYPSVILVLLGAFLAYHLSRRATKSVSYALAGLIGVALAVAEFWRYQELEYRIGPENGAALASVLEDLEEQLEAASPDTYKRGIIALEGITAWEDLDAGETRLVERAIRKLEGMRPSRYDDAEEEIVDLLEEVDDGDLVLSGEGFERLREAADYYAAFSLMEDIERLSDDLRALEEPGLRRDFMSKRAFSRIHERLDSLARLDEDWTNTAEFKAAFNPARGVLAEFDPDRLSWYPWLIMIVLLVLLAQLSSGRGLAIFTGLGFLLVVSMGFWTATMESLALVLSATLFALIIGIPVGISAARNIVVDKTTRPILDFMQTMPAFVYLIPAVLFFGLGKVPGAMATLIFAMPPAVRLTSLGIRQVPTEVVEACLAFGATPRQLLYKAQLPIARPTILAGLNQTIMLALSMVVIGGMIGAGGLGQEVLSGITQLKIGLGFESGIAVVILAIFLDRVTQSFGAGATR